jgi:hypothetical protein
MQALDRQWYVKWFKWNCKILDRFWETHPHREHKYENRTNLCAFFQILFWGTVLQIVIAATYVFMFTTVFILPWVLFPATSVLLGVGSVLAIFLVVVLVVISIVGAKDGAAWMRKTVHKWVTPEPEKPMKFIHVVCQYVVSIKHKFCPTISFKKEDKS